MDARSRRLRRDRAGPLRPSLMSAPPRLQWPGAANRVFAQTGMGPSVRVIEGRASAGLPARSLLMVPESDVPECVQAFAFEPAGAGGVVAHPPADMEVVGEQRRFSPVLGAKLSSGFDLSEAFAQPDGILEAWSKLRPSSPPPRLCGEVRGKPSADPLRRFCVASRALAGHPGRR